MKGILPFYVFIFMFKTIQKTQKSKATKPLLSKMIQGGLLSNLCFSSQG